MELNTIEQELRLLDLNRNIKDLVLKMIQSYGQSQWDAALDKGIEKAEQYVNGYITKQDLLNLKIGTK